MTDATAATAAATKSKPTIMGFTRKELATIAGLITIATGHGVSDTRHIERMDRLERSQIVLSAEVDILAIRFAQAHPDTGKPMLFEDIQKRLSKQDTTPTSVVNPK